jgi:inorganic triphosphatase YgiF
LEIELKLAIDAAGAAALRHHPLVLAHALGQPQQRRLTSLYFDTPDLHLRRNGLGLRVRHGAGRWTQTLKDDGRVHAGLHSRGEWESPVREPRADLDALRALPVPEAAREVLAAEGLTERLAPLFGVRVRRTLWRLRLAGGDEVELALDEGELRTMANAERVREVELELLSGAPGTLFEFALALAQTLALRPDDTSKAARGYALLEGRSPGPVKAEPLALAASMTVEQALVAIVGTTLSQVQRNAAGVMQGSDPECVHQMRVGLRRLRSALRLFADVAPLPQALHDDIAWLGGALGGARDWEVLGGGTLPALVAANPGETGLAPLQDAALERAARARASAAEAVGSQRYARCVLQMGAWLHGASWRAGEHAAGLAAPLSGFAAHALARRHARLQRRGTHLDTADAAKRHRARIAAKRLRYASEFFASLYPARRATRFVGRLTALQDALGWLNDAAVADTLLRELARDAPALEASAAFARGWLGGRAEGRVRQLRNLWRRYAKTAPPWAH